jgi:GNAT superfamily N-acetyltransferase
LTKVKDHGRRRDRFEGRFDPDRALQPGDDDLRPLRGVVLLATADGQSHGCVAVRLTSATADLKRLWVAPASRGLGLASRLLAAAETGARALGATTIRLDTNRALTEAIALYRARGLAETRPSTPSRTPTTGSPRRSNGV